MQGSDSQRAPAWQQDTAGLANFAQKIARLVRKGCKASPPAACTYSNCSAVRCASQQWRTVRRQRRAWLVAWDASPSVDTGIICGCSGLCEHDSAGRSHAIGSCSADRPHSRLDSLLLLTCWIWDVQAPPWLPIRHLVDYPVCLRCCTSVANSVTTDFTLSRLL